MFVRPCWQPNSPADTLQIIQNNPWALLVSNGPESPLATNLPLLLEATETTQTLIGHLANANAHLAHLQANPTNVLAIFHGPSSYVTAGWYPARQMPSTYYYTAVHCYGSLQFQSTTDLDQSLAVLTDRMESPHPNPWRTTEIPRSEILRRLPAITGFRLTIDRMEAKFKLGQDEPLQDALAVATELSTHPSENDRTLAQMIRQQNATRP